MANDAFERGLLDRRDWALVERLFGGTSSAGNNERVEPARVDVIDGKVLYDGPDSDIDLLVVMPIVGRRHDASVRVLDGLRDMPVPIDITVVDQANHFKITHGGIKLIKGAKSMNKIFEIKNKTYGK